ALGGNWHQFTARKYGSEDSLYNCQGDRRGTPMTDVEARIKRIESFKKNLIEWEKSNDETLLKWLQQNKNSVEREVMDGGCWKPFSFSLAVLGPSKLTERQHLNVFESLFVRLSSKSLVPHATRMLDETIHVLKTNPPRDLSGDTKMQTRKGYAFVAMPM